MAVYKFGCVCVRVFLAASRPRPPVWMWSINARAGDEMRQDFTIEDGYDYIIIDVLNSFG